MLPARRRETLLDLLRRDGGIVAKEAAAELGISEDTVRRDLREMAAAGLCQRVYGGALPASPAVAAVPVRRTVAVEGKRRVAAAAARLVTPGATVILDGGTTALAVAAALVPSPGATLVTHSPAVAAALAEHTDAEVYVIGGKLFRHSVVACGAAAVEAAQRVSADLFLLGVTGVHAEAGLTTGDGDEAAMKRALAARAGETWVMASSEKMGAASRFPVMALGEVAGVITDAPPDADAVRALREAGVTVVHAA